MYKKGHRRPTLGYNATKVIINILHRNTISNFMYWVNIFITFAITRLHVMAHYLIIFFFECEKMVVFSTVTIFVSHFFRSEKMHSLRSLGSA